MWRGLVSLLLASTLLSCSEGGPSNPVKTYDNSKPRKVVGVTSKQLNGRLQHCPIFENNDVVNRWLPPCYDMAEQRANCRKSINDKNNNRLGEYRSILRQSYSAANASKVEHAYFAGCDLILNNQLNDDILKIYFDGIERRGAIPSLEDEANASKPPPTTNNAPSTSEVLEVVGIGIQIAGALTGNPVPSTPTSSSTPSDSGVIGNNSASVASGSGSTSITNPAGTDTCVEHVWYWNGGNYHRFVNNCSYQVLIRAKYNNGYVGMWGPLNPGHGFSSSSNPGKDADYVNYSWCNRTSYPSCSPPKL